MKKRQKLKSKPFEIISLLFDVFASLSFGGRMYESTRSFQVSYEYGLIDTNCFIHILNPRQFES